jgi:D-arginine dehydrogenase
MSAQSYDAAVVGGGIAGVSAAYELGRLGASVILLEREAALAHHTTGRSAAQYLENYGDEAVRRLTLASRPFFESPPEGFAEAPLLAPRPMLEVGGPGRRDTVEALARRGAALVPSIRLVGRAEIAALCPVLRPAAATWGSYEPEALDLDVMALHQGYVRGLRAAGGEIARNAPVDAVARDGAAWVLGAAGRLVRAGLLVNAAGAWADELAVRAGVAPRRPFVYESGPPCG